ncbi:hypothetical protein OAC45_01835 [Gammaproteobacteria bacterium]|nr:hypothetical protein [Gammaproteobacteria bacterium]
MAWLQSTRLSKMDISLNKVLTEAYEISSGLQERLESIYPIECNVNFSGLPVMSLYFNHHEQILKPSASGNPQFTLIVDPHTTWNLLKEQTIPSDKIEGDSELALMFLMILGESNIDLELLIYKNFGTIPGLVIRKILSQDFLHNNQETKNIRLQSLQASLRNISIRIDRMEQKQAS